jgi:hypothetical protein
MGIPVGRRNIHISPEPSVDHASLKTPLVAYTKSRDLFLGYQTVNSKLVHFQIMGNLFRGQKNLLHLTLPYGSIMRLLTTLQDGSQ